MEHVPAPLHSPNVDTKAVVGVKSAERSRWFGTVPTNAYELTQMLHSMQPSNVTMFSPGKPEWQTEMNGAAALEQSCAAARPTGH